MAHQITVRRSVALILGAFLLAFITLAAFAVASDTTPGDVWLTRHIQSIDVPAFATALNITEDAAQFPAYFFALAVAAFLFWNWGGARPAMTVLAVPLVFWLTPALKTLIGRPRPDASLVDVVLPQSGSMSFPSGHAFSAVLIYGLIFCLAAAYIPIRWLRLGVQSACVWIIVLTCIERVYVGRHWPSDVLGGIVLGVLVVAAFLAIERRSARTAPTTDVTHPAKLAPASPRG